MMETPKKRKLIDVDEFEEVARKLASIVGIKDNEARFTLNDMIRNVRSLVKPVNDWRTGKPDPERLFGHYLISYKLKDDRVVVGEAVYSTKFGWEGLNPQGEPRIEQNKVLAWQPLPDPYDFRICRHCNFMHHNVIVGDYCEIYAEEKDLGETCGNWEKKEDFCQ